MTNASVIASAAPLLSETSSLQRPVNTLNTVGFVHFIVSTDSIWLNTVWISRYSKSA